MTMKRHLTKWLAVLLALLMLVAAVSACSSPASGDGKTTEDATEKKTEAVTDAKAEESAALTDAETSGDGETGEAATDADTSDIETEEETTKSGSIIIGPDETEENTDPGEKPEYEKDDIPEDLDYGEYEFHILCDKQQYPKSFVDVYTGDMINSALFNRKSAVEKRLNLELVIDRSDGTYNYMAEFIQHMVNMGNECDLVLAYNLTPASMAIQGLICDMTRTDYLNFDKPWWSKELLQNVGVDGKVFFTADNASWNNIRNMLGLFVDKSLFLQNHPEMSIDDLYDLVEDNEWTMEKMFELVDGCYFDKDGDGIVGRESDVFGLSCGHQVWIESWYFAAGFITLQKDDTGVWNFNIGNNEQVIDFVNYFNGKFYATDDCVTADPTQYAMFKSGRVQFYVSALSMVEQQLEQEFAVLPEPMYSEEQESYYTHFSNTYDMYAIPVASKDKNRSSAVLECLASEAYRTIAPAYFENYLKIRNASDDRLQNMYDILRANIIFDSGVLFGELFVSGNNPVYYVRRALSMYDGYENLGAKWTNEINAQYLELWQNDLNILSALED